MAGISALFAQTRISALLAEAPLAVIKEVTGKVEIRDSPAAAWAPALEGTALTKDTVISTGFKSVAVVSLGNSTLTVRPLTRLTLEEIARAEGSEQVQLYLLAGRVRAEVTPPAGGRTDFSVRSPSATASVRGTSFSFDSVNLNVIGGLVRFSGSIGNPVYVGAGEGSFVGEGGRPANPSDVAAANALPTLPVGVGAGTIGSLSSSGGRPVGEDVPTPPIPPPPPSGGSIDIIIGW